MEDVLTSCVFGLLRHLPPEDGMLPLLSLAQSLDGKSSFHLWPARTTWSEAKVTYKFWPGLAEAGCRPCEPDVMLTIDFPSQRWLVLVEAKFRSGKSSFADEESQAPNDQLAREFDNLVSVAARAGAIPVLVYLTADIGMPRYELIESTREYKSKYPSRETPAFAWLGWRMLHGLGSAEILTELGRLLERLDLIYFQGLHFPEESTWEWKFEDGGTAGSSPATFGGLRCPGPADWAWTFSTQN